MLSRSTPTTQQEKADLMTAWTARPLEERAQVEAWFEANREEGLFPASMDPGRNRAVRELDAVAPVTPPTEGQTNAASLSGQPHDSNGLGGLVSAPAGERRSRHSGSPQLSVRPQRATRPSRQSPLSRGSLTPVTSLPQISRANRFASDNKRLYF